jgi:hypothetical protein
MLKPAHQYRRAAGCDPAALAARAGVRAARPLDAEASLLAFLRRRLAYSTLPGGFGI